MRESEGPTIAAPSVSVNPYSVSMHWWVGDRVFFASLAIGEMVHPSFCYFDGSIEGENRTDVPISLDRVKRILRGYARLSGRSTRLPRA